MEPEPGRPRALALNYPLRLFLAGCLYALPPLMAIALVQLGLSWLGLALVGTNLLFVTGLLLVFSVLPWPAGPRTLRTNDFSDLAWLPHVAVTRLTNRELGRQARRRVFRRCLATTLVVGGNGGALVLLCARTSPDRVLWWCAGALLAYCLLLVVGFVGRERAASRRPLAVGTDIG